jgi:hypothetical protein
MIASDWSLLERLFLTDLHKAVLNLGLGWQLDFEYTISHERAGRLGLVSHRD